MKRTAAPLSLALLVTALIVLPGCSLSDWMGGKNDAHSSCGGHCSGQPVISLGNKVVLDDAQFQKKLEMIYQSRPGVQETIQQMPAEEQIKIYEQIADGLATEQLILKYVQAQGLDTAPEYREAAHEAHDALDRDLALRAFQNNIMSEIDGMTAKITDEEAQSFYEKNRETVPLFQQQMFLAQPAGVKAQGIVVSSEKEAQTLAEDAKRVGFANVAKDAKKKIVDYGLVTQQSQDVDHALRINILNLAKVPAITVVKDSAGKYVVVNALSKQKAVYAEFVQVRDFVKQAMIQDKLPAFYQDKMSSLKKEYNLVINAEYLKNLITGAQATVVEADAQPVQQATEKVKAA